MSPEATTFMIYCIRPSTHMDRVSDVQVMCVSTAQLTVTTRKPEDTLATPLRLILPPPHSNASFHFFILLSALVTGCLRADERELTRIAHV